MTDSALDPAGEPGLDPVLDLAVAHALVRRASRGELDEVVRLSRPPAPVVAFGRRDTRLPGFPAAVAVAREHGFTPAVRAVGGRAVAYTTQALVVDHVRAEADPAGGHDARFRGFGERLVGVLRGLGVDARLGAVPGEYCPGAHSVNAHGTRKLVGTAQRVVKGAWLFSSLLVVDDADVVRPVLTEVYGALGQVLDPASVGSVADEVPGLGVVAVAAAVAAGYGVPTGSLDAPVDGETLAVAADLLPQHRVDPDR